MTTLDIQTPGDWLYDTRYWCTCRICNQRFSGPKRASYCWTHESEEMKEAWVASHQEPKNLPIEPTQMVFPFAWYEDPSGQ